MFFISLTRFAAQINFRTETHLSNPKYLHLFSYFIITKTWKLCKKPKRQKKIPSNHELYILVMTVTLCHVLKAQAFTVCMPLCLFSLSRASISVSVHIYVCFCSSTSLSCSQVCREFQRGNCARGETDCRFAHPSDSPMIDTSDNTVTVCMDYIKSRCSREKCKYFHPPAHLQAKIKAAQHQANQTAVAAQAAATAAAMVRAQHYRPTAVSRPHSDIAENTRTRLYFL